MSSSTARNGALAEVDREIEARKAALRAAKEEVARRNGNEHVGREVLDLVLPDDRPADQKISFNEKRRAAPPAEGPAKAGGKSVRQLTLEAAAALYKPGEPASPTEIAARIGSNRSSVSAAICALRKEGRWPYEPGTPGRAAGRPRADAVPQHARPEAAPPRPARGPDAEADAELLVVRRIMDQLGRLASWSARRRVLAYIDDRMTEQEEPWPAAAGR